jgi:energy-coupling factor transporter ATP-binding protein EcfA2
VHLHADHPLFFAEPRPLRATAWRLALGVSALIVNSWAADVRASLAALLIAGGLLLAEGRTSRARTGPLLAVIVTTTAAAVGGGLILGAAPRDAMAWAARVAGGGAWVLWLGSGLDWPSLRALLVYVGVPRAVVSTLDHAVLHGLLTVNGWQQRRDTARVRLGRGRLPASAWASVLGEGALDGLERVERVEEAAVLRSAPPSDDLSDGSVVVDGLCVPGGERRLLDGLSLRVAPGEWVAVCGASGAGKTSLLRALAGLLPIESGTIERLGRTLTAATPWSERLDGRVGLLTQNPEHHFLASTAAEDVAWAPRHRGCSESEALGRARATLDLLGLAHLSGRACHALSFGEQRRLALAGVLVDHPRLLLLDEPTAGLDPLAAQALSRAIEALDPERAACLWATHDLHHLPARVRRIVLLRDGRVVFDGPREVGTSRGWLVAAGLAAPDAAADTPSTRRTPSSAIVAKEDQP